MWQIATNFIKKWEGFSSSPYLCPAYKPTIGYGIVILNDGIYVGQRGVDILKKIKKIRREFVSLTAVNRELAKEFPNFITEKEASNLLETKLRQFWNNISKELPHGLTDNQCAAILSLTYNIGTGAFRRSTLLQHLKKMELDKAQNEFIKWRFANGVELPGLRARRLEESKMFGRT